MAPLKDKLFDHLLIDGDVVAFIAAASVQHNVQDRYGNVTAHGNLEEGQIAVDLMLSRFKKRFGKPTHDDAGRALRSRGSVVTIILSDPEDNWRFDVDQTYKGNRVKDGEVLSTLNMRPLLLLPLKQYLRDKHQAYHYPRLEADDTLSYLATVDPDDNTIVIGRDKDFKSIPGWHFQISPNTPDPYYILPKDADHWHLMQAMAGDATDGFGGCPGIGLKRADAILREGMKFVPVEGTLTSGKHKGLKVTKWHKEPCANPWEIIVSVYQRAGLDEHDALVSARLARLLRAGEYDTNTNTVKLWEPSNG